MVLVWPTLGTQESPLMPQLPGPGWFGCQESVLVNPYLASLFSCDFCQSPWKHRRLGPGEFDIMLQSLVNWSASGLVWDAYSCPRLGDLSSAEPAAAQ